jgi:predicted membrane-bound spermidine synthase
MLGFTLPLLVFGGLEGLVAALLLLPLPFSRPAIWLCKQSKSQIGRTVVYTIAAVLLVMLAAPLYDILHLHDRPEATAGVNIERRETEATANLGAVLTGSTLVTMFVLRKLGLALAEIDDLTAGGATQVHSTVNSAFDTKDA